MRLDAGRGDEQAIVRPGRQGRLMSALEWLGTRELLGHELAQAREQQLALGELEDEVEAALADERADEGRLEELYGRLEALSSGDRPEEPSELEAILASLDAVPAALPAPRGDALADRIHGAWLGRCAGCTLGKPVEGYGWNRRKLAAYLELAGVAEIDGYLPVLEPMPDGYAFNPAWTTTTKGRVHAMARDDDLDYTILGLAVLERHGASFQALDVAAAWLASMPAATTYTAERVAYRNLLDGLVPPATARVRNPYREWIGALIRADIFGYVRPGDPIGAARLAYRDASLSHVANGLYGELWAAALVAAALALDSAADALDLARHVVPPRSRLRAALEETSRLHAAGRPFEETMDRLDEQLGQYHWIHTINNAAAIAAALLYGEGDFSRTIGLAVGAGLDTDCAGATAGSVFGALHGTAALGRQWVEPLEDTVHSAIFGFDGARISELAARTHRLAGRLGAATGSPPGAGPY